jgi:hypothetical protein
MHSTFKFVGDVFLPVLSPEERFADSLMKNCSGTMIDRVTDRFLLELAGNPFRNWDQLNYARQLAHHPSQRPCHTGEVIANADIESMSIDLKMLGLRLSLPKEAAIYSEIPRHGTPLAIG